MTFGDGFKAAALLFVAAVAQVSVFSQIHVFGAVPDVLLVTLVGLALLRGSIAGAVGGFFAGLDPGERLHPLGDQAERHARDQHDGAGRAEEERAATGRTRRSSRSPS